MPFFLILFFLVYGLFQCYFYCKLRAAYRFSKWLHLLILLLLLVMTFTPVLIQVSEKAGFDFICVVLAVAGFSWMGFVFEFTCIGLAIDIIRLISLLTQKSWSLAFIPSLKGKQQFLLPATLALALCTYGFIEARSVKIRHIQITTNKLSSTDAPLKLIQISDLHMGLTLSPKRLRSIVNTINAESPDVIVATGDIVESHAGNMVVLANTFAELNAPLGKFAVTGNHEYYADIVKSVNFLQQSGFSVLENIKKSIGRIDIAGVNDPTSYYMQPGQNSPLASQVLSHRSSQKYTILLKHRPHINHEHRGRFDLQLSGHSHNGQLFPFNFLVGLRYSMPHSRLIDVNPGFLYVNPGTGTWGPPFRILAPPEITVFTISPKK